MKFIKSLSDADRKLLEDIYKNESRHRVRQRAHAILLSAKGYTIPQLVEIMAVGRDAISRWFDAWTDRGISGLQDEERSGRHPILSSEDRQIFKQLLDENPHQLKTAVAQFEEKTGQSASLKTYHRTVKKI